MVARKRAVSKKATSSGTTAAAKAAVTKKAAARPAKAIQEPYTRAAMLAHLADETGLTKKDVSAVIDGLRNVIEGHMRKGGAQVFTMPGLFKIKVTRRAATRARKGINPFTGEEMMFKAKPARNVVKMQPLKGLKDMVS